MNQEQIILVGGGGHCISCIDVIRSEGKFQIIGILDITEKLGSKLSDIEVIGTDDDIPRFASENRNFLITVGQIKTTFKRIKIYNTIKKCGGNLPVIISPRAYVSNSATIGEGTIVMHNSLINASAVIGNACIINTGALIEHEVFVGDFCHISTQSILNGQVKLGRNSFIGSNAVIANNITLPPDIVVAAGTCVFRSTDITGTYFGNPARKSP
jgi:sugar O-acyltransferase (sialic acid O-acetyltransferase NeuD family)